MLLSQRELARLSFGLTSSADMQPSAPTSIKNRRSNQTVRRRIERLFLENLGKVLTRDRIQKAARDPKTKRIPENWHQRLSELRTDSGYTILTHRDRDDLKVSQYLMETAKRRRVAGKRVRPSRSTWAAVLGRAKNACQWVGCDLKDGDKDPVGGGTVRLTPDHRRPHAMNPNADPNDPNAWQALCGRHQVIKKNFWDSTTGKLNVIAIVQNAPKREKRKILKMLKAFFGEK
jgi:hypothetical protein